MKRSTILWQFALLAAVGCSAQPGPVADAPTATETAPRVQTETGDAATAVTFVSLKVPNMV